MKIVICGDARTGKTVFSCLLLGKLPEEGVYRVEANPDGEGMWSNGQDQDEIQRVREKEPFSRGKVDEYIDEIRAHDDRVVLVDVGGMLRRKVTVPTKKGGQRTEYELVTAYDHLQDDLELTPENARLFEECDAYIVLGRSEKAVRKWVEAVSRVINKHGKRLICLAEVISKQEMLEEGKIYFEPKYGTTLRGTLLRLNRGETPLLQTQEMISMIIRHILEATKDESRPAERFDVDGFEIAEQLGLIERVKEDCTKNNRRIKRFKERLSTLVRSISQREYPQDIVSVGNLKRKNYAVIAICDALQKKGKKNIQVFDAKRNKLMPIKHLPEVPGIEWTSLDETYIHTYKIESKDSVFLSVDVMGKVLSDRDYSHEISMPEVDDNKTLFISGRIPLFLLLSLVLSSGAKRVFVHSPGTGYTCVRSDNERELGRVVKKVPGIDTDRFFEDKKSKEGLRTHSYEYVREEFRTEEQIEHDQFIREQEQLLRQPEEPLPASATGGGSHSKGKVKKNKSDKKSPAERFASLSKSKQQEIREQQKKARERAGQITLQSQSSRLRLRSLRGHQKPKNP